MLPPRTIEFFLSSEVQRLVLTDSNHLEMARLHRLLKHGRICPYLLEVFDISGTSDNLATMMTVSFSSNSRRRRTRTQSHQAHV